jgi:hypothetical protein
MVVQGDTVVSQVTGMAGLGERAPANDDDDAPANDGVFSTC